MTRRQRPTVTSPAPPSRRVVFLALPEFDLLDLAGPNQVFFAANRLLAGPAADPQPYAVEVVAAVRGRRVRSACGLELSAHHGLNADDGPIDTLLVPAAGTGREVGRHPALLAAIRRAAGRSRRVASVCGGAFVLAAAGLLDGRRATTHWIACEELARDYPAVTVEMDPIFVRDGHVYTSAGSTAGIDLALALVEEDHGRAVSMAVARQLVMFVRRPGGQSQFSPVLEAQATERDALRDLLAWVAGNLAEDLSVERLADRAHMSLRNFTRVFRREVGKTPARYIERLRVDAARRRLEESAAGLDEVAAGCGFGCADSMRRSFLRVINVAPSDYRDRFKPEPVRPQLPRPGDDPTCRRSRSLD